MDINDHLINYILNKNNKKNKESNKKNEKPSTINTLILNSANIYSFEIKDCYQQIECLSLRESFLKNISFILNLPNIYYLDLYGNPIENYKPLIKIGTFGFLCISPPLNYFEKQILCLKSLNVIILQAEIKDKGIYNNFLLRNPNILVLNNTIIDFGKKIRTFYTMINFRYYIQNFLMEQDDFPNINNNINNHNKNSPRRSTISDALNNRDIFLEKRLKTKQKKVINKKCLEIIKFYDEYNKNLFEIYKNNKMNFNQDILCVEEKKKFLMIYNAFNHIGNFFNKNNNCYIYKSKTNLNKNLFSNYPNINIEIFNQLKFLQYKEFVLSIIILYLFSILSKDITYFLILLIFKKTDYYNANNNNKTLVESDLKLLLDIDKSFLFAFYFKIYDILFEATGKNIDLNKLYEIQDRLKMIIIADKINEILSHQKNFINDYKMNTDFMQKNKIITKDFIRFLFDIKIFHKIFNIIQFVNDFIIYNNLITQLGNEFPEDMHFFNEVQGLILINFDKSNEIKESMADKNYNKIQINSLLNNKFFFKTQNYYRTKQNNSFYNYKHKIFYPNKKKMNYVENLKPFNELKKEKEELIKQNYINNVLSSFFKVINKKTNNPKQEFINNLKLNNFLLKKNKHRRNNSRQYESNNNINNYLSKTYTNYKNQNNLNNEVFLVLGKTTNNIDKFKILTSPIKPKKSNKKTINPNQELKNQNNNLFNNDILNLINTKGTNTYKNSRYNSNELTIHHNINKNRKNKLFFSYDCNKNKKQTNQFILTINKKLKKHQYSLRLFKKGMIITNNNNLNNYNNFKIEDKKSHLREFNTVSYNHLFYNFIGKKSSPFK